ncbi:MAG: aldehyde dehydrogenase family protein, partial [Actinomycetota bacterium]|nr:aldehyde dehydrogenase family protein [Actinomycetota bacterium]
MTAPQVQAHVGGWLTLAGPTVDLCNPADTRETVAVLRSVETGVVADATARAAPASARWARTSPLARGEILRRAADHLVASGAEIAVAMTRETGKIIVESRAEVVRAADVLRFMAQSHRVDHGRTGPLPLENEIAWTVRMPLGTVAVITPWNFPLAIPAWKIAAALIHGNAVVFKPAELAPLSASALVHALLAGGLDPDLIALLPGDGAVIGPALVGSPDVAAVTFTGSTA